MSVDRRAFLTHAAGFGAAVAIADLALVNDALAHAARAVATQPRPAFSVLTAAEAREVEAIASRIVPTTETPGAREAGVVYFVDRALATFQKDSLADLRKGLADVKSRVARRKRGATSFASLTDAEQDALLTDLEKGGPEHFGLFRFMTFMGVFGEPAYGGNRNEVGWKLLDFKAHGPHKPPFGYYDAQAASR